MVKFTIRDLLWLTTVIAVLAAWIVDRSKLAWQYEQADATIERLRAKLDVTAPEWRTEPQQGSARSFNFYRGGYVGGIALFVLVVLVIILVWQGTLHWSLLSRTKGWW